MTTSVLPSVSLCGGASGVVELGLLAAAARRLWILYDELGHQRQGVRECPHASMGTNLSSRT